MTLELRNDMLDLPRLTDGLTEWGEQTRIPEALIRQLDLALEEIVTNVIAYAYSDEDEHLIRVHIGVAGGEITAVVEDDGVAFNPLERAAPDTTAAIEDREIGGLGIHIVRELMDSVRYDRVGGRNRLTITKLVEPA